MVQRAKRTIEEVVGARTSGVQRRERRLSEDPRVEPDHEYRSLAPTERPPAELDGPPTGLTPRPPAPTSSRDVHAYLVALAVEAGAEPHRAGEQMANAATAWNIERMERAALVDAYLRHDVAAILRLVQLLAEDVDGRD
jgi:hypothetical protein